MILLRMLWQQRHVIQVRPAQSSRRLEHSSNELVSLLKRLAQVGSYVGKNCAGGLSFDDYEPAKITVPHVQMQHAQLHLQCFFFS